PRDNSIAVRPGLLHAEGVGAVADELIEFDEAARVEQLGDPLACGHLALGVLLRNRSIPRGRHGFVVPMLQVGEFAGRWVHVGGGFVGHSCVIGHLFTLLCTDRAIPLVDAYNEPSRALSVCGAYRGVMSPAFPRSAAVAARLEVLDETPSTNDELVSRASIGA